MPHASAAAALVPASRKHLRQSSVVTKCFVVRLPACPSPVPPPYQPAGCSEERVRCALENERSGTERPLHSTCLVWNPRIARCCCTRPVVFCLYFLRFHCSFFSFCVRRFLSPLAAGRNDELDMRGMNEDDLMTLCALSGCDYLPSVHGVGLKKAHRLVARHREVSWREHPGKDEVLPTRSCQPRQQLSFETKRIVDRRDVCTFFFAMRVSAIRAPGLFWLEQRFGVCAEYVWVGARRAFVCLAALVMLYIATVLSRERRTRRSSVCVAVAAKRSRKTASPKAVHTLHDSQMLLFG